jgi:hypothetical protein
MSDKSSGVGYAATTAAGFSVQTTTATTALAAADYSKAIVHDAVNTKTDKLTGKTIVAGISVETAYTLNGVAAVGGSMTFTFHDTDSTISGTPDGKYITITAANGEERTFTIRERTAAVKVDAMVLTGFTTGTDRIGLTVPTDSGGAGAIINIQLCNDTDGSTSAGSGVIGVGTSGASASTVAEAIRDAVNGTTNGRVHFGSGISASGVAGLTGAIGTSGEKVSLTATSAGASGNDIVVANTAGDAAVAGNLAGGSGPNTSTKNEFDAGTTATLTAVNFKAQLEDTTHGFGTSTFTTTLSSGQVTIVNQTTGPAGNNAIGGNFADICSVNPPSYFSGGAAATTPKLTVQYSHNGTDWTAGTTILSDLDLTNTGSKLGTVYLADAPYVRFVINEGLTTMENVATHAATGTGTHKAFYAAK